MIKVNFDGSCLSNPHGSMGMGVVITFANGQKLIISKGIEPRAGNSSNLAEYLAIKLGVEKLIELGHSREQICIVGDSLLVISQLNGERKIKKGFYYHAALEAKSLVKKFSQITFEWIPREDNIEADKFARAGHDECNRIHLKH